MNIFNMNYW